MLGGLIEGLSGRFEVWRAKLRMNGQTDRKTEVWKFPPVFYGKLALWGPCPKSGSVHPKLTNTAKPRLFKKQIRDAKTDS